MGLCLLAFALLQTLMKWIAGYLACLLANAFGVRCTWLDGCGADRSLLMDSSSRDVHLRSDAVFDPDTESGKAVTAVHGFGRRINREIEYFVFSGDAIFVFG